MCSRDLQGPTSTYTCTNKRETVHVFEGPPGTYLLAPAYLLQLQSEATRQKGIVAVPAATRQKGIADGTALIADLHGTRVLEYYSYNLAIDL